MEVLIFKTNVDSPESVDSLMPFFNKQVAISKLSFDLEDCDRILRIETSERMSEIVVQHLRSNDFECEELYYSI